MRYARGPSVIRRARLCEPTPESADPKLREAVDLPPPPSLMLSPENVDPKLRKKVDMSNPEKGPFAKPRVRRP